jgi:hypothetical protein
MGISSAVTNFTVAANTTRYNPIYIPASTTFDRIALRTGPTFSGTASVRLAIYDNSGSNKPSTVSVDGGTVSCTAANTNYEVTISKSLTAGWYWLAYNVVTAATVNNMVGFAANSNLLLSASIGQQTSPTGNHIQGYNESVNVTSGYSTAGTLTEDTATPAIWIRSA